MGALCEYKVIIRERADVGYMTNKFVVAIVPIVVVEVGVNADASIGPDPFRDEEVRGVIR